MQRASLQARCSSPQQTVANILNLTAASFPASEFDLDKYKVSIISTAKTWCGIFCVCVLAQRVWLRRQRRAEQSEMRIWLRFGPNPRRERFYAHVLPVCGVRKIICFACDYVHFARCVCVNNAYVQNMGDVGVVCAGMRFIYALKFRVHVRESNPRAHFLSLRREFYPLSGKVWIQTVRTAQQKPPIPICAAPNEKVKVIIASTIVINWLSRHMQHDAPPHSTANTHGYFCEQIAYNRNRTKSEHTQHTRQRMQ